MKTISSRALLYAFLATGLLAFGFAPIIVRLGTETPALTLVTYRTVFAAAFLLPFWLYNRRTTPSTRPAGNHLKIALAGIGLGLHFSCWLSSLYYTSVASASVLVTMHPVLIIFAEWLLFKNNFSVLTWVGVMVAFSGSVLLSVSDQGTETAFANPVYGNVLAILAAVIFVVYLLIGRQVRQQRSWLTYVFPVYAYAAGTCLVLAIAAGVPLINYSPTALWVGLGLALGPQILGHGSMNYAIKDISPTLLSTLILVEPLLASILAYFIFNELPPPMAIGAMVLVLAGIGLTWRRKR